MAKEKVSVKFDRSQLIVFFAIFGIIAAVVAGYLIYEKELKPQHRAMFEGFPVEFRGELRESQAVDVQPDESKLRSQIVRPPKIEVNGSLIVRKPLGGATIAFKQTSDNSTMSWYVVQSSEIAKKLTLLYKGKYDVDLKFNFTEVDSYEGLKGTNSYPVIALVHPEFADGTYISVNDDTNVITISGGDSLKDFDNAVTKFLMVALDIVV